VFTLPYFSQCFGSYLTGYGAYQEHVAPRNKFAFGNFFDGPCYAEKVSEFRGVEVGKCFQSDTEGTEFAKVTCSPPGTPSKVELFADRDCLEEATISATFTSGECTAFAGETNFIIHCNGEYELPPHAPETDAPTYEEDDETDVPTVEGESTPAPTKAPTPKTNTCSEIPRGCSAKSSDSCAGSASWTISGESYTCECASSEKTSKVTFKVEVKQCTVSKFNEDACTVGDFFTGIHSKVYEKTQASIVNDFPVEVEGSLVTSGSGIIVKFAVLGFFDSAIADEVVAYINGNKASFEAAIESAASDALDGAGVDVALVANSVERVDDVTFCGCKDLGDGSGASGTCMNGATIAGSILAGLVAIRVA
jgi:hypothetical protein